MITNNINRAVVVINYNSIVVNAYNDNVIHKIFELQKSPPYKPLIIYLKSATFLHEVAQNIPEIALKLSKQFWSGPLTLLRAVQI
jgi:L-threonylcarbamoyladenylate synthase